VVLVNYGDRIDISGWSLSDTQGHIYRFENFYLDQASAVRLYTGVGTDGGDLYWGQNKPIWTTEEPHVILFNNFGAVIDRW
jgi:hypothetical protein